MKKFINLSLTAMIAVVGFGLYASPVFADPPRNQCEHQITYYEGGHLIVTWEFRPCEGSYDGSEGKIYRFYLNGDIHCFKNGNPCLLPNGGADGGRVETEEENVH